MCKLATPGHSKLYLFLLLDMMLPQAPSGADLALVVHPLSQNSGKITANLYSKKSFSTSNPNYWSCKGYILKIEKKVKLSSKHLDVKKADVDSDHIWILLLNSLQFLYIDFYNGEIGCPTPKRFNSPSTQNKFCNNWGIDATFSYWP